MVVLTKRQKNILSFLCEQHDYVTVFQLSQHFGVSERTIRNDFQYVDSYLKEKNLKMERRTHHGIQLCCNEEEKTQIRMELGQSAVVIFDKEERLVSEIFLLMTHSRLTLEKMADICRVSKQTVVSDLVDVERRVGEKEISIRRIQGKGIEISGEEAKIRQLFQEIIQQIETGSVVLDVLRRFSDLENFEEEAERMMLRVEKHMGACFTSEILIQYLIEFSLLRAAKGKELSVETQSKHISAIQKYREYDGIYNILDDFHLQNPDRLLLCDIFMNAKMVSIYSETEEENLEQGDNIESEIAKYLFKKLEDLRPLDKSSKEYLLKGLTIHLKAAIYRTRNRLEVENELLEQIKISIPLIYQFTQKELNKCEDIFHIRFEEKEIAYIAIYIASAFENTIEIEKTITILLVCSFGVATSSILKTRIKQVTTNCVVRGPLSKLEAMDYLKDHQVDLIISTNEFLYDKVPVIRVNPLLYADDVNYIKNRLFQMSYANMCECFIESYEKYETEEERIYIYDYVKREDIQILNSCDCWQNAIRQAAEPLVRKDLLAKSYVNKMIEAVNQFGTYMVLTKDTAFVHAGTEDGINDDCTAILVLNNPIMMGDNNRKSVRNFVVLGIKNKYENSLLKLIYVFENQKNLEKLKEKGLTIDDIYEMHN